jgi:hypothetical protein
MQTVFTDAGKVAGFIIQRGRIGFEVLRSCDRSISVCVRPNLDKEQLKMVHTDMNSAVADTEIEITPRDDRGGKRRATEEI